MAVSVRAKVIVNYQTPIQQWHKAIKLVLEAMRLGKLEYKDVSFTDSLEVSLSAGHAPTNQAIDLMNMTLDRLNITDLS